MERYQLYFLSALFFFSSPLCVHGQTQNVMAADTALQKNVSARQMPQIPTKTITGLVTSAESGLPLAGAMVSTAEVEGYSTLTKEDGSYELKVPTFATSLLISAPDYQLIRRGIGSASHQGETHLYPSTLSANYTTSTNITSDMKAEHFEYSPAITIEEEIQKRLGAYAHTIGRSGTPGIGSVINIGGINSLYGNTQPLIIIDGVIFDQQYSRQLLHGGFYNDILANISPSDIERVTVMRNGTALYGAKGSNGVILIDTRRNKSMATRITASLSGGVTLEPRYIDMMGAEQYRSYVSELLKTTNTTVQEFKFLNEDPNYYYYGQYHNNTDWKEQTYRTAITQNYSINVEGGDQVASYNLSLGYTNAQSTLDYNNMNRLNIRFNTDIAFSRKFKTRFDASFVNQNRNLRDDGTPSGYDEGSPSSPSFLAYAKSPFLSPFAYVNGSISPNHLDVNDETYLDEALHNYSNYNYKLGNPYALNKYGDAENKNRFENSMLNISVTPRYDILPSMTISEHFSYNLVSTNEKYYIPIYGMPDYYVESVASTRENEVRSLFSKQNSLMSDTRLQWKQRFQAHHLNIFGGARINWETYHLDTQLGYNTGNDKTPFIKSELANAHSDGGSDSWTSIAWYAQAQYDFLQRYYLQLNLTAETSSRFGKDAKSGTKLFDARWGIFPGVQVGWVLTSEPWLADKRGINYLRLSAGIDMTGNDDITTLAVRSYFGSHKYLEKILGLTFENIGNSRLQWETTRRLSASLEGNFLDNRLNLHIGVFSSKTDNLLTLQQLSYLTGLENNWKNGGSMTNKGFDLSLTGRILVTRNWQWELGGSVGHYKNEITSLPGSSQHIDTNLYNATIRSQIGHSANVFYGYRTIGVFATSEEASSAQLYQMAENGINRQYFSAGDIHFEDMDNNGRIDEADRTVIGDPNPDFYGNIFSTLVFKRLRLDINLNYSVGNDVYNYQRSQLEGGQRFMNQTLAVTRRWHGEGHQTDIPRIAFQDPMGNSRFSDRWIEDGSYLKLKSVTLSYQLPLKWAFLQGMEFWLQANNIYTFTKYLGGDPETAITSNSIGQGIDIGLLPSSRSFVGGIKINL